MIEKGAALRGLRSLEQQAQTMREHEYKMRHLSKSCEKISAVKTARYDSWKNGIKAVVVKTIKFTEARSDSYDNASTSDEIPERKIPEVPKIDDKAAETDFRAEGMRFIRKSLRRFSNWLGQ